MKLGMTPGLKAGPFLRQAGLAAEWIEDELPALVAAQVPLILVDPDQSETLIPMFKELPRPLMESRFVDAIRVRGKMIEPQSAFRGSRSEFFSLGCESLNTALRAYVTGTGPWARLFAVLAVEMGFRHLSFIVEDPVEARVMITGLRHFCFGVQIEALRHADLTLQPNNGSLLVNTVLPASRPEMMTDLAYLNYLSPQGLVVETCEDQTLGPLLEEAKNSNLQFLDGACSRGFSEYKALSLVPGLVPWEAREYLEKRKAFFQA